MLFLLPIFVVVVGDKQCFSEVSKAAVVIRHVGCTGVDPGVVAMLLHVFKVVGLFVVCVPVGVDVMIMTICFAVGIVPIIITVVNGKLCISAGGIFCCVRFRFSDLGIVFCWVVFVSMHMLVVD